MPARDLDPAVLHDRALSVVGVVLPVPDALGTLRYADTSPWIYSDTGSALKPSGSICLTSGAPEFVVADVRRAALHAASIGVSVQAYDADLAAIAALTSAADKVPYATGAGTWALASFTVAGRAVAGAADAAAQRAALDLEPGVDVQAYDVDLTAIAALVSAANKAPYATGAGSWAMTDFSPDQNIRTVVTVADVTGGATDGPMTVDLFRTDGVTRITSARQFMILATSVQYSPTDLDSTVTFSAATVGSIVATGSGWCLAESDATGNFACTVSDSADETVYFACCAPRSGQSDVAKYANVWSNSDAAAWSA